MPQVNDDRPLETIRVNDDRTYKNSPVTTVGAAVVVAAGVESETKTK